MAESTILHNCRVTNGNIVGNIQVGIDTCQLDRGRPVKEWFDCELFIDTNTPDVISIKSETLIPERFKGIIDTEKDALVGVIYESMSESDLSRMSDEAKCLYNFKDAVNRVDFLLA